MDDLTCTADVAVPAPDGARSLARIGAVLGAADVSLAGGGMWSDVVHYLVADGDRAAKSALPRALEWQ